MYQYDDTWSLFQSMLLHICCLHKFFSYSRDGIPSFLQEAFFYSKIGMCILPGAFLWPITVTHSLHCCVFLACFCWYTIDYLRVELVIGHHFICRSQYRSSHHGSAEMNLTSLHEDTGSMSGLRRWHLCELWCSLGLTLWLWHRPVATAQIWPLAWEPPCAEVQPFKKNCYNLPCSPSSSGNCF